MKQVSVIVPIFNVAPYLRDCLDSLVAQTHTNLQIILVNDGSTDNSESIAEGYLYDPRVELITVDNGGLSYARNIGLKSAKGDFIYFIDSDDFIDHGYIEELVSVATQNNVEFVCNDQIVSFTPSALGDYKSVAKPKVFSVNSTTIEIGGVVCRCLFARSLLQRANVEFIKEKIYEDEGFLYMVLPYCHSFVRFCGKPYFYRKRDDSIISLNSKQRSEDLIDIFETIYNFYLDNDFIKHIRPPYFFLYASGIGYSNQLEYLKAAKGCARQIKLYNLLPSSKDNKYDLKVKILMFLFRLLPGKIFVIAFTALYKMFGSKTVIR